jgi:hypothetical protein
MDYAGDRREVTCVIKKQRSIGHSFGYVPSVTEFSVTEFLSLQGERLCRSGWASS